MGRFDDSKDATMYGRAGLPSGITSPEIPTRQWQDADSPCSRGRNCTLTTTTPAQGGIGFSHARMQPQGGGTQSQSNPALRQTAQYGAPLVGARFSIGAIR
jgi:hypothetical protein